MIAKKYKKRVFVITGIAGIVAVFGAVAIFMLYPRNVDKNPRSNVIDLSVKVDDSTVNAFDNLSINASLENKSMTPIKFPPSSCGSSIESPTYRINGKELVRHNYAQAAVCRSDPGTILLPYTSHPNTRETNATFLREGKNTVTVEWLGKTASTSITKRPVNAEELARKSDICQTLPANSFELDAPSFCKIISISLIEKKPGSDYTCEEVQSIVHKVKLKYTTCNHQLTHLGIIDVKVVRDTSTNAFIDMLKNLPEVRDVYDE